MNKEIIISGLKNMHIEEASYYVKLAFKKDEDLKISYINNLDYASIRLPVECDFFVAESSGVLIGYSFPVLDIILVEVVPKKYGTYASIRVSRCEPELADGGLV